MTKLLRDVIRLKSGKILQVKPLDACKLLINTSSIAYLNIQKDNDMNVTSVSFENQEAVSLGDEFLISVGSVESIYKVNMISVEKNRTAVIIFSSLPNKTSIFLTPMLNKSRNQLKIDSYFINSYISDCHQYLCLLYRYTGTNLYKTFEENMIKDKLCVKHIEHDKYHVMYLFKIPDEFKSDIEHFLEGNYSKFSKELKNLILKFYNGEKNSTIVQIINKSPSLKKIIEKDLNVKLEDNAELASKPILQREIYPLSQYQMYTNT